MRHPDFSGPDLVAEIPESRNLPVTWHLLSCPGRSKHQLLLLCFLARSVYGSLPGEVLAGDGLSPEERPSPAPASPYRASVTTLVNFEGLRAVFPGTATYRERTVLVR